MRLWLILGAALYVALLNGAYEPFLVRYFEGVGYRFFPPPAAWAWLPWTLGILPALWLPLQWKRPSSLITFVLYVLVIVPATVIPFYSLRIGTGRTTLFAAVLLATFSMLAWVPRLPLVTIRRPSGRIFGWTVAVLWVALAGYAVAVFGVPRAWPEYGRIFYQVRPQFEEAVAAHRGPVGYAVLWLAEVLNPLLIAAGLAWPRLSVGRRVALVAAGLIAQAWIFSFTGYRSALFSWVPLALLRLRPARSPLVLMGLLVAALGASLAGPKPAADVVVRRSIATPGLLTGYYFEFFSENPKVRLSHSVLRKFVDSPYEAAPPQLIGEHYFPKSHDYASANLWADAYANFGFVGMFAFTLLLAGILWLFDALAQGRPPDLVILMLVLPAYILCEAGLLTCLLSHGIGLTLLLAWLLPAQTEPQTAPPI